MWRIAQAIYFCYILLYNSFVTISTRRSKAIPWHNSLDANMSFQIHPARSNIQKSSSCAVHSSSGQGEHTLAPGFQLLQKHSMPQAWKSVTHLELHIHSNTSLLQCHIKYW